ncbi:LysR family transcriptional regulator [Mesorhizobium sp. LjRoot246]|uniref:LysR family transcriptional regulator n=1 Tax=Mesorhizobium sp. LjRoot246 TaxID=3342294 RepID=UPI003ECFB181
MRLTLRQIRYVHEVARLGSISAACASLHMSASPVLAAIKVAEEEVGTAIFVRRAAHGVDLTPAGQKFLVSVRRFLSAGLDFERSVSEVARHSTHTISIGCFSPFGGMLIPPVLRRFIEANGDCEIILREGEQPELRRWLATGEVDLVVAYDVGDKLGTANTPICKMPAHAIMRVDDPLAKQESVSIRDIAQRPLILLDLPETRTWLLTLFDFAGERPKIGLRARSYESIRAAVANGLGVSIFNMRPLAEASPDSPLLTRIPISDPLRQPTLIVADPYGAHKPAYVNSFIQTLYQCILDVGPANMAVVQEEFAKDLMYPRPK